MTGLVYLNNRYYDPSIGVFLSVDPLVAKTGQPYLYAVGNPTTLSDPSGLCTVTQGMHSYDDGKGPCGGGGSHGSCAGNCGTPTHATLSSNGPGFKDDGVSITDMASSAAKHGARAAEWVGRESVCHGSFGGLIGCPKGSDEDPVEAVKASVGEIASEVGPSVLNSALKIRLYGRAPDYVVLEGAAFTDFYGLGAGGFLAFTRSGQVYLAPIEVGVGTPGAAVTVRAGWIAQGGVPSDAKVEAFVGGWGVNASANGGPGQPAVAVNWGTTGLSANDFSAEAGLTVFGDPGVSLAGSYAFEMADSGLSWVN